MNQPNYCLLIPHYNHAQQLLDFFPKLQVSGLVIVIVDDGSDQENKGRVESLAAEHSNVHCFFHAKNRGKGAAVKTGFVFARHLGFSHAIQIDADGQHSPEDIPNFIECSKKKPSALICGKPIFDDSVLKVRQYGRKFTDFWIALESLSLKVEDSLCGFRVYPISEMESLLDDSFISSQMDFDPEIIVKAIWYNIELEFVPTNVIYPKQGVSHFNYLRDNLLFIQLHTRLMFGMVFRIPPLLSRKFGLVEFFSVDKSMRNSKQ